MSRLDLVIFGATGFTGRHVVVECAKLAKKYPGITWGIAGRSMSKLEEVLIEASTKLDEDVSWIKKIVASVDDKESLRDMCEQANVLVNCCGPYWLHGEPVVAAAVQCKTHYVDVSGETQFIESMQLRYDTIAREASVFVINACGFESVPNDLGVIYLERNFEGTLNAVESYVELDLSSDCHGAAAEGGIINYGTWASIIHAFANRELLTTLRKQLFPGPELELEPKLEKRTFASFTSHVYSEIDRGQEIDALYMDFYSAFDKVCHSHLLNKLKRWMLHRRDGRWCMPFKSADNSVVYRTQRRLASNTQEKRPVQFRTYFYAPGTLTLPFFLIALFVVWLLTLLPCGRRGLLKHPRLFSLGFFGRESIESSVMEGTRFTCMLHGTGWSQGTSLSSPPDKSLIARVTGTNPGYGAAVVALLHCALSIIQERGKMPEAGGVLTTGYAFKDTTLIQRLSENNIKFEIVDRQN